MTDDNIFAYDADIEQAQLEEAGYAHGKRLDRMRKLRAAGKILDAAIACPHSWYFPLRSQAAESAHDPRSGQDGFRCLHCGSALASDPMETNTPRIIQACEIVGQ